jgi:hypothetical protein
MAAAAILKTVDHFGFCDFDLNMFISVCVSNFIEIGWQLPILQHSLKSKNVGGGHLEN